jgi:2',3'-cyclic-nucleotide 2'-phosphodiesterase/3'-nucleotidase/5'-nucleotidase
VLVLDAGDMLIKDQSPATTSQGASSVEAMNMMGYDAAALGEGDLALLGVDAIRLRMAEAEFAFLSANAYLPGATTGDGHRFLDGQLLAEPYRILEVGTQRVALIGITAQAQIPGVETGDPIAAVQEAVRQIGDQAEVLILLSHAGLEVNHQIAAQVPALDLIVSGGGAQMTYMPEGGDGGPLILHADISVTGHAGRRIGVGTFAFDQEGVLQGQQWRTIALDSQIPDDPAMSAWVASHR